MKTCPELDHPQKLWKSSMQDEIIPFPFSHLVDLLLKDPISETFTTFSLVFINVCNALFVEIYISSAFLLFPLIYPYSHKPCPCTYLISDMLDMYYIWIM